MSTASRRRGGGPVRTYTRPLAPTQAMAKIDAASSVPAAKDFIASSRGVATRHRPSSTRKGLIQISYRVFDPLRERFVVVAGQVQGRAEHDANAAGPGHAPRGVQHLVEADDA